jgi:hypothetical protein
MQKLVYWNRDVAWELRDKIAYWRPGRDFAVYALPDAYQVVEIKKVNGAGYYWSGSRWTRYQPKKMGLPPGINPKPVEAAPTVTVTVGYHSESPAYLNVIQDGSIRYFGRANVVSYKVDGDQVTLTLPLKFAQKRGFACA